ncbi:MAG: PD-(D/E)XK nuclease family protein [Candidatus Andersenbacteria bacterium]
MTYTAQRKRNLFNPTSSKPFKVSRSKIDLFLQCPKCLYLDRRLGIKRPEMPRFSLNIAVDELLKREFDIYREKQKSHPIMTQAGLNAVPFLCEELEAWRDSLRRGIMYHDTETNLIISGGIDDVWVRPDGELIIVDYKATSTKKEINLDDKWKDGYKRQMEVYQWLFRKNGFKVSSTGYFVYCNGVSDNDMFDAKLDFEIHLLPYRGDDSWIKETIQQLHRCLTTDRLPPASNTCEYCAYREAVAGAKIEKRLL